MNNKMSVTVGIPVHNEAGNIAFLLESILKQKQSNYWMEKILVVCDGTTDGTDAKVRKLTKRYNRIELISDGKRKGKLKRLTQLYKENKSDILIIFDGDVVLGGKGVLNSLVDGFVNSNVGIVGGNNQPVPARTFVEKLINTWSQVWYEARSSYNSGNCIHNIRGCVMALRKEFARTIVFPSQLASESQYIYLYAIQKNIKFRYAKDAVVYYRKPNSIKDYFMQFKRSTPESIKLEKIFGKWIHPLYEIPLKFKIRAVLKMQKEEPIYTPLSGIFTFLAGKFPVGKFYINKKGIWETVESTKKGINLGAL